MDLFPPYDVYSRCILTTDLHRANLLKFAQECIFKAEELFYGKEGVWDLVRSNSQTQEISKGTVIVDFLMCGIFWNNYSKYISYHGSSQNKLFNKLFKIEKQYTILSPYANKIRSTLTNKLLAKTDDPAEVSFKERLPRLLLWLDSTKEFEKECHRLEKWVAFGNSLTPPELAYIWANSITFAKWFTYTADDYMASYIQTINNKKSSNKTFQTPQDGLLQLHKKNEQYLKLIAPEIIHKLERMEAQKEKTTAFTTPEQASI